MFLSLCFSLLATQEPVGAKTASALDHLPADTVFIAELRLDTWDRLRAETRAHGVLRGWDLFTRAIEAGESDGDWPKFQLPGDKESAFASLRDAMAHSRFTIAMTPETLNLVGGALFFVEEDQRYVPEGLWKMYLGHIACEPHRVGDTWVTVLADRGDLDAAEACLQQYLNREESRGHDQLRTLGDDPRWQTLSRAITGKNDLARCHFLTWNLDGRVLKDLMRLVDEDLLESEPDSLSGEEADEFAETFLIEFVQQMGLMGGISWTTSIDGEDFVDRAFIPRFEGGTEGHFLVPLRDGVDAALDQLAAIPSVHPSTAVVLGLDFSQYSRFLEAILGDLVQPRTPVLIMEPAPPPPEIDSIERPEPIDVIAPGSPFDPAPPEAPIEPDEPDDPDELDAPDAPIGPEEPSQPWEDEMDFVGALKSVSAVFAELHPELHFWTPIGWDEATPFGGWRLKIRDRDALDLAYQRIPPMFRSSLEGAKASLALAGLSFELVDDEIIVLRKRRFDQPLRLTGEQPGFAEARVEMEEFLEGKEAILVQFTPAARDEVWLTRDGGLFLLLEVASGKNFGVPELPDNRSAHLQPLWAVAWRNSDGLHWQARSTFGWIISSWTAESSRAAWREEKLLERRNRDDFDEAEF